MKSYEKEYRHCLENSNKMELVDKIIYDEKEIERLNNELENVKAHYETEAEAKYYEYIDNHESKLQQRIDKAIEYLESYNTDFKNCRFGEAPISLRELGDLLDILKGENNE